jgi:hypothetical protein
LDEGILEVPLVFITADNCMRVLFSFASRQLNSKGIKLALQFLSQGNNLLNLLLNLRSL